MGVFDRSVGLCCSCFSVAISELISRMEMRLRTPVTRGYFFLLGALRLVNAASLRNIDQKKNFLWNPGYPLRRLKKERNRLLRRLGTD